MSKRSKRSSRRKKSSPQELRQKGAAAFRRGDYDLAVAAWRRVSRAQRDPALTAAFAEAQFRQGLKGHLDGLRQAANLAQDEPRYLYHLALAHHRAGELEQAEPLYRRLIEGDDLPARAAAAWGLLLMQSRRRPSRDPLWGRLAPAPDDAPLGRVRRRLAWAENLIFRRSISPGPPPDPLWQGLTARAEGQADPAPVVPSELPGTARPVARYHLGARAWEADEPEPAYEHWQAARQAGLDFSLLRDNLFAAARTVATERLKAGDVDGALEAAEVGLTLDPDDRGLGIIAGQAHFSLGHTAAVAGDWDQAYEHWQKVEQVGGQRGRRLVINLALAEEQREDWFEAAELWREALRRRPRKDDHPDALSDVQVARLWRHVAESYRRVGNMHDAKTTYLNALKYAPDDVELRTAYVDFLLDDGRLIAADNQLVEMLEAHPNDVELLDRRAQIYAARYYISNAVSLWERILELEPDHTNAGRQIARVHERQGDRFYRWGWLDDALHHYELGLSYAPNDGVLLVSAGMCHLTLGDVDRARQFFERAYAAEPHNVDVYLLAIKNWLVHDEIDEAEAVIHRADQTLGLTTPFFADLADFCYQHQELDWAQDFMGRARALAADDVNLLLMLADVSGRHNNPQLALDIVNQALKIDPNHGAAHLLHGFALVHLGDIGRARRSWDKAERIARQNGDESLLRAVEEVRFFYDPDHGGPPISLLQQMLGDLGDDFFDDE